MKYLLIACTLIFSLPAAMSAQKPGIRHQVPKPNRSPVVHKAPSRIEPEEKRHIRQRQEILNSKLELSPVQESKIQSIKKDTRQKVRIIKNDRKLSLEEKENKLRYVMKEAELRRNEVLTPEQRNIFDEEMELRKNEP
ncbi:MAG: hypothetical protein KL787_03060 [Taibaiella sp.]|nr:hypothetical protein [Taibaiella sp.]